MMNLHRGPHPTKGRRDGQRRKVIQKQDIYWGWFVVAGAFLVLSINYGARYCFGIFVKPMSEEYQWSRSVISMGASLNMLVYSVCAIYIGRLLDKMAPRWIITLGASVAALGFILTSLIKTPLQFYLVYGILLGIGSAGMGVVVCNPSVGKWFIRKRGIAIGITTMGISFGTIALTPLSGYIVKAHGWQGGFLFLGAVTLIVGVSLSQLLLGKTRPEDYGLLPDGETDPDLVTKTHAAGEHPDRFPLGKLLTDSRFWTLGVCYGLTVMTMMTVFVHQVPYALDRGMDKVAAASSLSAIGLAGFCGQFFFGWLSDRLKDAKYASCIGMILMAAGMAVLLNAATLKGFYLYALVFGFGYGSVAPMMPVLAANRFGRHVMGSVYGLLTFLIGIGGAVGPLLGGLIYDVFGSYKFVWQLNALMLTVVAFLILTLRKAEPGQIESGKSG
jgi:sugar phosphate permease